MKGVPPEIIHLFFFPDAYINAPVFFLGCCIAVAFFAAVRLVCIKNNAYVVDLHGARPAPFLYIRDNPWRPFGVDFFPCLCVVYMWLRCVLKPDLRMILCVEIIIVTMDLLKVKIKTVGELAPVPLTCGVTTWKEGGDDPEYPETIEAIHCECLTREMLRRMPNVRRVCTKNVEIIPDKYHLDFVAILERQDHTPIPNARTVVTKGSVRNLAKYVAKMPRIRKLLILDSDHIEIEHTSAIRTALAHSRIRQKAINTFLCVNARRQLVPRDVQSLIIKFL